MLLKYKPGDEAVVLKLDSQFPERSYSLCYIDNTKYIKKIHKYTLNSLNGVIAYATIDEAKVSPSLVLGEFSQFPERSYSLCYTNTGRAVLIARPDGLSIP